MNHKQRRLISANRDAPLLNQSVNRFHLVHDELNSEAGINRNNDMSYMQAIKATDETPQSFKPQVFIKNGPAASPLISIPKDENNQSNRVICGSTLKREAESALNNSTLFQLQKFDKSLNSIITPPTFDGKTDASQLKVITSYPQSINSIANRSKQDTFGIRTELDSKLKHEEWRQSFVQKYNLKDSFQEKPSDNRHQFKTSLLFSKAHESTNIPPMMGIVGTTHRRNNFSVFSEDTIKELNLKSPDAIMTRAKRVIKEVPLQIKIDKSKLEVGKLSQERRIREETRRQMKELNESQNSIFERKETCHYNISERNAERELQQSSEMTLSNQASLRLVGRNRSIVAGSHPSRNRSSQQGCITAKSQQKAPSRFDNPVVKTDPDWQLKQQLLQFTSQLDNQPTLEEIIQMHQHLSKKKGGLGRIDFIKRLYDTSSPCNKQTNLGSSQNSRHDILTKTMQQAVQEFDGLERQINKDAEHLEWSGDFSSPHAAFQIDPHLVTRTFEANETRLDNSNDASLVNMHMYEQSAVNKYLQMNPGPITNQTNSVGFSTISRQRHLSYLPSQNSLVMGLREKQKKFKDKLYGDNADTDSISLLNTTAQIMKHVTKFQNINENSVRDFDQEDVGSTATKVTIKQKAKSMAFRTLRQRAQIDITASEVMIHEKASTKATVPTHRKGVLKKARICEAFEREQNDFTQVAGNRLQSHSPSPQLSASSHRMNLHIQKVAVRTSQQRSPVEAHQNPMSPDGGSRVTSNMKHDVFTPSNKTKRTLVRKKVKKRQIGGGRSAQHRKKTQAAANHSFEKRLDVVYPVERATNMEVLRIKPPSYLAQLVIPQLAVKQIRRSASMTRLLDLQQKIKNFSMAKMRHLARSISLVQAKDHKHDLKKEMKKKCFHSTVINGFNILNPTLSLDNGPNCKDKHYNRVELQYNTKAKRSKERLYAKATCRVDVPHLYDKLKKRRDQEELEEALMTPRERQLKRQKKLITVEDNGPDHEEWSLPIKFIIKQGDVNIGEDFKQPRIVDFYVSQETDEPDERHHEMHARCKFNVKSKDNYDKEFGVNQVYQFIFKKDYILKQQEIEKNPLLSYNIHPVKHPNHVFVTIKCNKDCKLDIVAQLSLQPEPLDEQQQRMRELEKQRKKIDYEAIDDITKELTQYFDRNLDFFNTRHFISDKNFVKENQKDAETFMTMDEKRQFFAANNFKNMIKQFKITKHLERQEESKRMLRQSQLNRWDQYREQRESKIDQSCKLIKIISRNRTLITQIVLLKVLNMFQVNIDKRLLYYKLKFNQFLIAIRFKVMFNINFKRKHGQTQTIRYCNKLRKAMTLLNLLKRPQALKRAQEVFLDFLSRMHQKEVLIDKIKKYLASGMVLVNSFLMSKAMHNWHIEKLSRQFDEENKFLIWHFEKLVSGIRNTKLRAYAELNHKIRTFKSVYEDALKQEKKRILIETYIQLVRCMYLLDFGIFEQIKLVAQVKEIEQKKADLGFLHQTDKEKLKQLKILRFRNLERLKHWRIKINELECQWFVKSSIVDSERLFLLSYDQYNIEVKGMIQKRDEADMVGNRRRRPANTQSSMKKKQKVKRQETEKINDISHNSQRQAAIVDLLLDHNEGLLQRHQQEILQQMSQQYQIQKFPKFQLSCSRENLQRLIVRVCGFE